MASRHQRRRQHPARQSKTQRQVGGFSLVELAVILVIFGLLFGGIIKGQSVIFSADAKMLAADFRTIPVTVHTYFDLYRALPGDDRNAASHVGSEAINGNGNGFIEGRWNSTRNTDESNLIWQHLRLAQLMHGTVITSTSPFSRKSYPHNALNDIIGVQGLQGNGPPPIRGLSGSHALCSQGIPGDLAHSLDTLLDDGAPATGTMLAAPLEAVAQGNAVPATAFGTGEILTVCMSF